MTNHRKRKSRSEKYVGDIIASIAGEQYHDARVHAGETVHLEREPSNVHDANAIRVENEDFDLVGYVPRRLAVWLASLIDLGKISLDGHIPVYGDILAQGSETPLSLKVFLTGNGKAILTACSAPANDLEALHEMVRRTYEESGHYTDPSMVRSLGERLQPLAKRDVLPETRLLLALFPARADEVTRRHVDAVARDFEKLVSRLSIGRAMYFEGLTIFPIHGGNGQRPRFTLLEPAIKAGTARVEEMSEEGSVPGLRLVNEGDRPILVTEGEILLGGKQNRVVNITIIVAALSTYTVPVSCVEAGRWNYTSREFALASHAPPRLRALKTRSVHQSRSESGVAESDQGEVWDEVRACLSDLEVSSGTESVTDVYRALRKQLAAYRSHLKRPASARGFLAVRGNRVIGMDVFDSPKTLGRMWKRVSEAYFLEAARHRARPAKASRQRAQAFLKRVARSARAAETQMGDGVDLEIAGKHLVGSAALYDGTLCHIAAFPIESTSNE